MTGKLKYIKQYLRRVFPMLRRKREIIFSATIEYQHYQNEKPRYISKDSRDSNISFEKLESEVRNVLCNELPNELKTIYGIEAKIRHIATREGSMIVFFGVILTTYGIIANYKGFFEGIKLIRSHADSLLTVLLRKFNIDSYIRVEHVYPDLPDPNKMRYDSRLKHLFHRFPPDIAEMILEKGGYDLNNYSKRDGFFWYLIIMNIVLILVLGALVASAVIKVYF